MAQFKFLIRENENQSVRRRAIGLAIGSFIKQVSRV